MSKTMSVKVLHVSKTTAQWALITDVVSKGFLCVEFTTDNKTKIKIGDGVNTYANLPYVGTDIDLSQYYTKLETDSAISSAISSIGNVFIIRGRVNAVNNLPATGNKSGDVYFVGLESASEYEEYVWTETRWEYFGKTTAQVDLSNYYTKSEVDSFINGVEYDDTVLSARVTAIEGDYIKSTDTLILNCTL